MNEAEAFRGQAINELRLAILALQCGEIVSAQNHATCAIHWANEIDPAATRPPPNVTAVKPTSDSSDNPQVPHATETKGYRKEGSQ